MTNYTTSNEILEDISEILSNKSRIRALEYLNENQSVEISELGNYLDDSNPNQALAELYHNHLPRFEEVGLINYNEESIEVNDDATALLEDLEEQGIFEYESEHFSALSTNRRIEILEYITENKKQNVERIAEDLGENGAEMWELNIGLKKSHLPKFEEVNLVSYNGETVEATDNAISLVQDLRTIFPNAL